MAQQMDLRQIDEILKGSEPNDIATKKENLISNLEDEHKIQKIDSGTALQRFLDHIPISSLPGIKNSPVLELNAEHSVSDAIKLMYEKNVSGAPIADVLDTHATTFARIPHKYIGFIDLASLVLWSLEECNKSSVRTRSTSSDNHGFFKMLEQFPHIGQAKISELAKSFIWDPFLPVSLDASLFHVLLLLSKHPMQVVPVIDKSSNSQVVSYITQNAVIQLLLQSSGLEWFDSITDHAISEFRFENEETVARVYGDQMIAEALQNLWRSRMGAVAVLDRQTKKLIGCVRRSDVYLLLDIGDIFSNRKNLSVEKFIHMDIDNKSSDATIERDLGTLMSAGCLRLRDDFIPRMYCPVTNKTSDTLKQAMKTLADAKCNFSFLVDDQREVGDALTARDILIQFAPPCMDSNIHGGGFFEAALEQTGCHVQDGDLVYDH